MHGASYVSDAQGSVLIGIQDERQSNKYRQGSGIADFLLLQELRGTGRRFTPQRRAAIRRHKRQGC
jgi:hypothetical protein